MKCDKLSAKLHYVDFAKISQSFIRAFFFPPVIIYVYGKLVAQSDGEKKVGGRTDYSNLHRRNPLNDADVAVKVFLKSAKNDHQKNTKVALASGKAPKAQCSSSPRSEPDNHVSSCAVSIPGYFGYLPL